jgi:hypothetical protein
MKKIVLLSLAICAFSGALAFKYSTNITPSTTNKTGFAVVELFTSQGCSSCPPADDILRGLADKPNVFPLSFHVTYWNRLGWKDAYSQDIFDERQYKYGARFALKGVYTPQTVINGSTEMVGSYDKEIEKSIANQLSKTPEYTIELSKNMMDKKLIIKYKLSKSAEYKTLNMALTESHISTAVKRGENEGRTLKHNNVVHIFKTKKLNSDTEGVFECDMGNLTIHNIIVFLQNENYGVIVGAANVKMQ